MSQHNCLEEFNARIIERKQNFLNEPHLIILFNETKEIYEILVLIFNVKGKHQFLGIKCRLIIKLVKTRKRFQCIPPAEQRWVSNCCEAAPVFTGFTGPSSEVTDRDQTCSANQSSPTLVSTNHSRESYPGFVTNQSNSPESLLLWRWKRWLVKAFGKCNRKWFYSTILGLEGVKYFYNVLQDYIMYGNEFQILQKRP